MSVLSKPLGRIRAVAYLGANVVDPAYLSARLATARLARAPVAKVEAEVARRLHRYLTYCLRYSRFWQERWPSECRSFAEEEAVDVLARLPPLSKEDLRRHGTDLHIKPEDREPGDGYPATLRQTRNYSGGSTGVPVEVWQDRHFHANNRAVIDHVYGAVGLPPGRPVFYLWGSSNELGDLTKNTRKRISTWARGLVPMPAFALDAAKVRTYAELIRTRADVDAAICFVSALDSLLAFVEHEGIELRRISRVVTGGGKLYPELRERVRKLWADDVYETYGGRDSGLMAAEAPDHRGMQTFPWNCHVELLDAGGRVGDGRAGEIHVTGLQNYAFALIRLATGDIARQGAGTGGTDRARITDIVGRSAEHLTTRDGMRIDPSAVIHLIGVVEHRPWIRRFQLVQNQPDDLTLRLETWVDPGRDELDRYGSLIGEALGRIMRAPVGLRIEILETIPPARSGKHLYCVGWKP